MPIPVFFITFSSLGNLSQETHKYMRQSIVRKNRLSAFAFIGLLVVLALVFFFVWPKHRFKEVSKELDGNAMRASVMDQVFDGTFEALRQFKNENGYLPPEDNQSVTAALSGKNKIGKNYISGWTDLFNGQILDIDEKPLVFHFINDNEITVYSPATKQLFHGFLNSDKATVVQEADSDHE